MSSFEQESIASVTQLHELRTAAETYESFYQLYGLTELQRKGFSTILNRVLHIDETEDRSVHFVIAQAEVLRPPIRRRYGYRGAPMHYVPYFSSNILVASTDGDSITEYEVVNAQGTYHEHLNCTDKQYDPIHETMDLTFTTNAVKRLIRAEFNVATGNGTVELGGQPCGWILSDKESSRIREIILTPALPDPEPATALGHIATAS